MTQWILNFVLHTCFPIASWPCRLFFKAVCWVLDWESFHERFKGSLAWNWQKKSNWMRVHDWNVASGVVSVAQIRHQSIRLREMNRLHFYTLCIICNRLAGNAKNRFLKRGVPVYIVVIVSWRQKNCRQRQFVVISVHTLSWHDSRFCHEDSEISMNCLHDNVSWRQNYLSPRQRPTNQKYLFCREDKPKRQCC